MANWIWIDPAWDLSEIDPWGIAKFREVIGGYGLEMLEGSEIPKGVDTAMRAFTPIIHNPSSSFWPVIGIGLLVVAAVGVIYWVATRPEPEPTTITFTKKGSQIHQ
jgi:hypothetical protein